MRKFYFLFPLLFLISCTPTDPEKNTFQNDVKNIEETEIFAAPPEWGQGILVYATGEIWVQTGNEEIFLEIGDFVESSDILHTGKDAYCEIQFGNMAVARIESETIVDMQIINIAPGQGNVALKVKVGGVISKVKKLTGTSDYRIKTPTAICGVRGTEFIVRVGSEKNETFLAVKSGTVGVLPPAADKDRLTEKAGKKTEALEHTLESIEKLATLVSVDQQIKIQEETFREANEVFQIIESSFERTGGSEMESEDLEILTSFIEEKVAPILQKVGNDKEEIDQEIKTDFEILDNIKFIKIQENNSSAPKMKKVSLYTSPAGAVILLNNSEVGKDSYSRILGETEILKVTVHLEGYKDQTATLSGAPEAKEEVLISLLSDIDAAEAEVIIDKKEAEEKKPEKVNKRTTTVKVLPNKAEILIEGQRAGTGTAQLTYSEGSEIKVNIKAAGYESKTLVLTFNENLTELNSVKLKKIIRTISYSVTSPVSDANIFINGKLAGKGKVSYKTKEGIKQNISIKRRGYANLKKTLLPDDKKIYSYKLTAQPLEKVLSLSNSPIVKGLSSSKNIVVGANQTGEISAVTADGKFLWKQQSKDRINKTAVPVIYRNKVYYAGSREMISLSLVDGSVRSTMKLDRDTALLFGQKMVPFGKMILYPAPESLILFDADSGKEIKRIPLESGTNMTPAIYKNNIILADLKGNFLTIDPESSKTLSSIKTNAIQPVSMSPAIFNNIAVFSGRKGEVVCIDMEKGTILWETNPIEDNLGKVFDDLLIGNEGVFLYNNQKIYSLDLKTGKLLYNPIGNVSSAPSLHNGNLLYGNTSSELCVTEAVSGKLINKVDAREIITTRPIIKSGLLLTGSERGKIMIFVLDSLLKE